jgi:HEAT repeat protein
MQIAKSQEAHRELSHAVASHLDEPLLLELMQAADSCPKDQDCQAEQDLSSALSEITPALFRTGMKAAKTRIAKGALIDAVAYNLKPELVPDLLPLIADPDLGMRTQFALANVEDTNALAQLATLLDRHDRTDTIHSEVPRILSKYPNNPSSKAALPKLREMAKHDAQGWGKANAAVAVGKIEGESSIPFLIDFVHTETWGFARAAVIQELATFKANPTAHAELVKLAKDADRDVRDAAVKALK